LPQIRKQASLKKVLLHIRFLAIRIGHGVIRMHAGELKLQLFIGACLLGKGVHVVAEVHEVAPLHTADRQDMDLMRACVICQIIDYIQQVIAVAVVAAFIDSRVKTRQNVGQHVQAAHTDGYIDNRFSLDVADGGAAHMLDIHRGIAKQRLQIPDRCRRVLLPRRLIVA
jgi:hypothetical protein